MTRSDPIRDRRVFEPAANLKSLAADAPYIVSSYANLFPHSKKVNMVAETKARVRKPRKGKAAAVSAHVLSAMRFVLIHGFHR